MVKGIIIRNKNEKERKMKLSVIVCLYNTKKEYLDKCLRSIRESTLKNDEYELLVIDDGSSESYDEIIKKYNPVYVKTPNRGLLSARLYGIMIAKGEYIAFCDSDDSVSFNYYKPMLIKAEKTGADIVINDWAFDTSSTKYACGDDPTIKNDLYLENDEILNLFASGEGRAHSLFVQWNKLFKKSLLLKAKKELEKTDVVSNKPFTFSEDVISNYFAFKNAKKLVNIHTGYYFYHIHDEQSVSTNSKASLIKEIDSMSLTFDTILADVSNDTVKDSILKWRSLMARKHYSYAKAQGHEELFDYIKEKYNQEKLELAYVKDSTLYIGNILLGDNFNDIDRELYRAYKAEGSINVIYNKKDAYTSKAIDYLVENEGLKINSSSNKLIVVPKRKIKAKHKLVHNKLVYLIGLRLFKKGSKSRAFLKSKM